ncbi:hypothetical protein [Paenibacillus sedimenti]|uniref:Uncharacterized protein n=1 Tax=Paenibacillus sedimenti TaxID=2770274 RepID=A0A926KQR8_9BACL|nr:hypothetical protein [Paenibacillus sedimenti]MBD0381201.1 hypothetical protein [Paenibacillus sedimenti]
MQPTDIYLSEKLMQWHQQELEKEARELWKWKSFKQRKVFVMLTNLLFFV